MKLFNFTVLAVFFICIAQIYAKGFHCAEHVVLKKGEKCNKLFKITRAKDVYVLNPLINCDKPMTTKTKVCIERDSKYFQEDFNLEEHTIGKRDTCTKLASKFHTTVDVLKRFNYGILDCNNMKELYKEKASIQYRKDGNYKVNFTKSKDVTSEL